MNNSYKRRKDFEMIGWALVLSQLTMFFLSVVLSITASSLLHIISPLRRTWGLIEGYIVMFSAVGGAIPMLMAGVNNGSIVNITERREKAWPVQVIMMFFVIMGLQQLTSIAIQPIVDLLEKIGMSFSQANEVATSSGGSSSMILYSVIIAPICEEVLYRGVLLRSLEKYGKWFAIVISALVFGLMHANAAQFFVAVVIGLVFGYLALKYSIKLTIVLHMMNNLSVEILGNLYEYNQHISSMISVSFLIVGIATILLMIMSAGKPLIRDMKSNRTKKGTYISFFACKPVFVVFVYMIAMTVASILT